VTSAPQLILASTSPYRRALLERLGLPFVVHAPQVPEHHVPGEGACERAQRLALAKASAIAGQHPRALVIGSDQVACAGPLILDKPGDAGRCREQLSMLSGHSAQFFTACVLYGAPGGVLAHVDMTSVTFRPLAAGEIARYVEREQPFDCAGGFKAEGLGIALFERVVSEDPSALVGLPLIWLAQALRRAGCDVP
jgi:septum formation protein